MKGDDCNKRNAAYKQDMWGGKYYDRENVFLYASRDSASSMRTIR